MESINKILNKGIFILFLVIAILLIIYFLFIKHNSNKFLETEITKIEKSIDSLLISYDKINTNIKTLNDTLSIYKIKTSLIKNNYYTIINEIDSIKTPDSLYYFIINILSELDSTRYY